MTKQHITSNNLEQIQSKANQIKAISVASKNSDISEMKDSDISSLFSLMIDLSVDIEKLAQQTVKQYLLE
ncbi:hypothetical protein [uncultured Shewanella sp.]|uniref:hypothetical protein n=1 Tax=uncultured Shewanella sp. TaxID=173975 RepID=UPI0026199960|nr:hypothetical protein [uncultured Shewanella sp.]